MAAQSTTSGKAKPAKPYSDFPLFPHATRRWANKIRGKLHYFGPCDDPQVALAKDQEQRDDLHAGRVPRQSGNGLELKDLLNHLLSAKQRQVEASELTAKTFSDYHAAALRLVEGCSRCRQVDDLTADDFGRFRAELAKTRGPVAMDNSIQHVRTVFKYGYDAGLMDKPIRFPPRLRQQRHPHARRSHRRRHRRRPGCPGRTPVRQRPPAGRGCLSGGTGANGGCVAPDQFIGVATLQAYRPRQARGAQPAATLLNYRVDRSRIGRHIVCNRLGSGIRASGLQRTRETG